jgi:hypothetical protein
LKGEAMAYVFDFITPDGVIDHFHVGAFDDDRDALTQAEAALLETATAASVEVWRGPDRLGRFEARSR